MDIEPLAQDAFAHLGIEVRVHNAAHDHEAELVLEPNGVGTRLRLIQRSLVDARTAEQLVSDFPVADQLLVVVADRVTVDARRQLITAASDNSICVGTLDAEQKAL